MEERTKKIIYRQKKFLVVKQAIQEELLTHALNYINDNLCIIDFLENYDLELSEFEWEYYGLYDNSESEE